jgi:hypothetical protein
MTNDNDDGLLDGLDDDGLDDLEPFDEGKFNEHLATSAGALYDKHVGILAERPAWKELPQQVRDQWIAKYRHESWHGAYGSWYLSQVSDPSFVALRGTWFNYALGCEYMVELVANGHNPVTTMMAIDGTAISMTAPTSLCQRGCEGCFKSVLEQQHEVRPFAFGGIFTPDTDVIAREVDDLRQVVGDKVDRGVEALLSTSSILKEPGSDTDR